MTVTYTLSALLSTLSSRTHQHKFQRSSFIVLAEHEIVYPAIAVIEYTKLRVDVIRHLDKFLGERALQRRQLVGHSRIFSIRPASNFLAHHFQCLVEDTEQIFRRLIAHYPGGE